MMLHRRWFSYILIVAACRLDPAVIGNEVNSYVIRSTDTDSDRFYYSDSNPDKKIL